ncbi:protein of unknown function [Azospirillum lipoferum 4B]|uniref:Uncharacterized protein n=1 Tax=Azospirillum lipoferum (strain 4B) TaxID=862719 RepID=G7Z243_AZOL4|nr:protein of unknown function [Azospirillum lipoferum 4B]
MRPKHFCSGRPFPGSIPYSPTRVRFNEAQAFLLGKTPVRRHDRALPGFASMRPKHFCSGRRSAPCGEIPKQ